jgi:hypothetical protein
VEAVTTLGTKNGPVSGSKRKQLDLIQQFINVRSVCEECTVEKGYDFWLCHTTKKINGKQTVVSSHLKYHTEMCFSTGSAIESSVASDLTED